MKYFKKYILGFLLIYGAFLPWNIWAQQWEKYLFRDNDQFGFNFQLVNNTPRYVDPLRWYPKSTKLSGDFYIKDIGYVEIADDKPLTITNNGDNYTVTGTAKSRSVGTIAITGTITNTDIGVAEITGKISTLAGNYDLKTILLTPNSSIFVEKDIKANHRQTLTMRNRVLGKTTLIITHDTFRGAMPFHAFTRREDGTVEWEKPTIFKTQTSWYKKIYESEDGVFRNVDLSLAVWYGVEILHNDQKIEAWLISIQPNTTSKELVPGDYYAKTKCDGADFSGGCFGPQRKASKRHIKIDEPTTKTYYFDIRDMYGNFKDNSCYKLTETLQGEQFTSKSPIIQNIFNTQQTFHKPSLWEIISYIPQVISVKKIEESYIAGSISCELKPYEKEDVTQGIAFEPLVFWQKSTARIDSHDSLEIEETGNVSITSEQVNADETLFAVITEWQESISSLSNSIPCPHNLTGLTCVNVQNSPHFSFINNNPSKQTQNLTLEILAGKNINNNWIFYPIASKSIELEPKAQLKSLETIWANGFELTKDKKTRIFNKIRRNIGYLNRNNQDNHQSYKIFSETKNVSEFVNNSDTKSLIVEWWDIMIDQNILKDSGIKAIIALKDKNGNGGNVWIKDDVTDIYATIVAEKNIIHQPVVDENNTESTTTTENDKEKNSENKESPPLSKTQNRQLYIFGYIISSNHGSDCVDDWCFMNIRKNFGGISKRGTEAQKKSQTELLSKTVQEREDWKEKYKNTQILLEFNSDIIDNPPPGLEYFID